MNVDVRFKKLISNLCLTDAQKDDGQTKHSGVRKCLNLHYYNSSSETSNSLLVGSWGKFTRIRPPRDIDVMFILPFSTYQRYESRPGNKQSQLLQEVKGVLSSTYTVTNMSADGQIVLVPFASYAIEVVPAFLMNGNYWICDTNNGGRYKTTDPDAERAKISASKAIAGANTVHLIQMLKRWQEVCNVPLKSFWLELLAIEFLENWEYRAKSELYYDWMMRDFFKWLSLKGGHYIFAPGTYEIMNLGNSWVTKAESAYSRALNAIENESGGYTYLAGDEWQKIFGDFIPLG